MKAFTQITIVLTALVLTSCSGGPKPYRASCATEIDRAWQALSLAEAEGFAGTVSYTKALGLITTAKTNQTVENFDGCVNLAKKAQFYISESRQGR